MSHQRDQDCPCNTTLCGIQAHSENANQDHIHHREEDSGKFSRGIARFARAKQKEIVKDTH